MIVQALAAARQPDQARVERALEQADAQMRGRQRLAGALQVLEGIDALHPDRNLGLYSTLKTALIGMSRSFALEYGAFGIRVNTVMPGLIKTKLANAYDPEQQARTIARTPVGRLGEGEDIGNAVLYLSSPGASFVSGASLVVDGGLTVASQ